MDTRKRSRAEFGLNANGGFKKSKPEMGSLSSGIGSKSKPCTKFFSMAGCPFGENCHFLHYVPGGYNAVAQMMNLAPAPATRTAGPLPIQNGSAPAAVKTKLCNKYGTAEGCKFNDKCHFAHGERELGKPILQSQEDPRAIGAILAALVLEQSHQYQDLRTVWCLSHCQDQCGCFPSWCHHWERWSEFQANLQANRSQAIHSRA
ncbi:hypothetical protein Pfo_029628 [Paulownia fortunei]|nr:hypothetical protein Pfo_029628 [Paulownia fortunei]